MYTFDNPEIYEIVLTTCKAFAIDPSASLESEAYFRALVSQYEGKATIDEFGGWLAQSISQNFLYLTTLPRWIQISDWQFHEGKPMIFIGQIEVPNSEKKIFHDDTAFYLFYGEGTTKVVMQQY